VYYSVFAHYKFLEGSPEVSRCFNWYWRTATATAVTWQRGYPANYYPVPEG